MNEAPNQPQNPDGKPLLQHEPASSVADIPNNQRAVDVDTFKIWACLWRALILLRQNFLVIFFISVVTYGAATVLGNLINDGFFWSTASTVEIDIVASLVFATTSYYFTVAGDALVAVLIVSQLRNMPVSFAGGCHQLLSVLFPIFLFSILDGYAAAAGLIYYKVPFVIYAAFFWLTVQSMSVEGLGLIAGMRRSVELTAGNRIRFGGIVLLIMAVWEGHEWVLSLLESFQFYEYQRVYLFNILEVLAAGLQGCLLTTILATAYLDLRVIQEHRQNQRMFDVFK